MSTPLRAFFLLRNGEGAWDIQVYHLLEDVLRAWSDQDYASTTAVLHVGFERRPTRHFEDLATSFPGKVLLTPAARGALPKSFRSSSGPIGEADGEPIYLALEGWGYAADEPATAEPLLPAPSFNGWLRAFVFENPELSGSLVAAAIYDDEQYLANEASLPADLRQKLGAARLASFIHAGEDDPTKIIAASPPWLRARRFAEFELPVRLSNVLRGRDIDRISDLDDYDLARLLKIPNCGRTTIGHLNELLFRALEHGPTEGGESLEAASEVPLLEAVQQSLQTLSDRERDIMVRRMGLGCAAETLAQIGATYGITRERIRQLESKAIKRLIKSQLWDDVLVGKLQHLVADRRFPLPILGMEALDSWFSEVSEHPQAFAYLVGIIDAGVSVVDVEGIQYVTFLNQEAWDEMLETARKLLAGGAKEGWTEDECRILIDNLVPSSGQEFRSLLWQIGSKRCQFATDSGIRRLVGYGWGAEHVVEAIMAESNVPLHYSDIAPLASLRAGRVIDERRAHNCAADVGYLFAPGTYGLLKHLSLDQDKAAAIAEELVEVILEGDAQRQWHASELLGLLDERGISYPQAFDKYQLDTVLKRDGRVKSLGRMIWTNGAAEAASVRLEIKQTIISILHQAGRPLSASEIQQRLVAVRGLNEGTKIMVSDPLIKLDSTLWGLNDRDILLKRPDQPAFLDRLAAFLADRQKPIHIQEFGELFDDQVPARAVFSLTLADPRFILSSDQSLHLRIWS